MTTICKECGGSYEEFILPEHMEDVGGITVCLRNTVHVRRCASCSDELTMIPDMRGLVRVVAVARALMPISLAAGDIKLMRRALDMSQKEFAEAMEISPETVSRWEAGAQGIGGYSEKLVRHNVCALLAHEVPSIDYDPADITKMRIQGLDSDELLPRLVVERVVIKSDGARERVWDAQPPCKAA